MIYYAKTLINNGYFKILMIFIVLDIIFGILRSIKEKSLNSSIGIDGMIRKTGMIISIVFLRIVDSLVNFNLLGFVPDVISSYFNLKEVGISEFFSFMFIIFEILSVFKNAILCGLPIPKKFQNALEKLMKEFTGEIKEEKNGK